MLGSMTCYPLCSTSPWIGVHSLTRWKLSAFEDYLYYSWVTNPLIMYSTNMFYLSKSLCQVPLKELLWPYFPWTHLLGSPKWTHCLNPDRYYGVSIENTYCYRFSSTITKSIGNIWSTYDLTRRSKPLLTSTQAQYSLKVERQYNEVA